MAGQKPRIVTIPLTSFLPAIGLQPPSPMFHKYFSLVSASFSDSLIRSQLIGDQAASEYLFDISHASSASSEESACSVEPGSAEDVSKIVR